MGGCTGPRRCRCRTPPLVLSGALFGAMLPFLFGALTMLSVRKAAGSIIVEVQKQFREIKGLLAGEPGVECDSDTCVALCTRSSVKEMILPGGVAIFAPITIGLLIGAKCLGGMLVGAIASGFVLAVMMSNAGGAWDNSKKYIENENTYGGKKSETHKACVVGDTVGDPFKDTSGPALNILIKLMSVLALLLAPIFREDWATWWVGLIVLAVGEGAAEARRGDLHLKRRRLLGEDCGRSCTNKKNGISFLRYHVVYSALILKK